MSKLNIDQSSIKKLFEDKKSDFLIPDICPHSVWCIIQNKKLF